MVVKAACGASMMLTQTEASPAHPEMPSENADTDPVPVLPQVTVTDVPRFGFPPPVFTCHSLAPDTCQVTGAWPGSVLGNTEYVTVVPGQTFSQAELSARLQGASLEEIIVMG